MFSVPALVVAIGGIAHYGAWRVLWEFLIGYALAAVVQFSKGKVYKALEGPRVNACRKGNWLMSFGLVMLFPIYNWFVAAALVDTLNLLFIWRHHGTMPQPYVYCAVYAVGFALGTVVRTLRGTCDGGYGELLIDAERVMLLAAISVSAFVHLTPAVFAASAVSIGVVVVAAHGALYYKRERKRFLKTRELQSASEIAVAAAKERRKLKRERQMMAFRRSHRG